MIARCFQLLTMCVCSIPVVPASAAVAQAPEGLSPFVDKAVAELAASPLQVPQFKSAQVEKVEDLGAVDGIGRYLCWLENDQGRVGYMAIAGGPDTFHIMAFSATTKSPNYFLERMTPTQLPGQPLNLSRATEISFVEKVPLVASTETMLGAEPTQISELASSLASLLLYLQYEKGMLMFGRPGFAADPEYTRRMQRTPEPRDPSWQSATEECRKAIGSETGPRQGTVEQRSAAMMRQRDLIKPIIRRRLLNPLDVHERLEVLQLEWTAIANPTRSDISPGTKEALLLQLDYLGGSVASLKRDLQLFLKTRGRTARFETLPFARPEVDSLPTILTGPDGLAGVVFGCVEIDAEPFAWIFFPKTGSPLVRTLAERRAARHPGRQRSDKEDEAEIRAAAQRIEEVEDKARRAYAERGLRAPLPEKSVEERLREAHNRSKAFANQAKITEDRQSASEESIQDGVHLIRCSSLASWNILHISDAKTSDNWGRRQMGQVDM